MSTWGVSRPSREGPVDGRPPRRKLRAGEREPEFAVRPEWAQDVPRVVEMIPGVLGVMAAAFEHKRGGVLVHRIMKCADDPACIAVAVPKGQRLATLIRDSHAFALSLMDNATKLVLKKFAADEEGDPFDTFPIRTLATGSPILTGAVAAMDCEVMRHFDLEADHELYVGQVIAATVIRAGARIEVPGRDVTIQRDDSVRPGERGPSRRQEPSRPIRLGDTRGEPGCGTFSGDAPPRSVSASPES